MVYYEDLVLSPQEELDKLFKLIGEEPIIEIEKLHRRLSSTVIGKRS